MSGLDLGGARNRLRPGPISWELHFTATCASTQDLARQALKAGAGSGYLIATDFQSAGRGRQGRGWSAPAGRALLFSAILPPAGLTGLTPLLAGLAVADGIAEATGIAPEIKWPNDLLYGGRKLAGILAERPSSGLTIIGVGINVNQSEDELPPAADATSVAIELGHELARESLLAGVLNSLNAGWGRAAAEGSDWIVPEVRRRVSMLGREVSFTIDGVSQQGVAEDIDAAGGLVVRFRDGRRTTMLAGDVREVRPARNAPSEPL